ncbi:hypothetical protein [Streptomyces flavofungini]|uniref:hypothetical protein n=1 Tax=Streptomyces flavofungini TaxID=68200 RepID=UPI0025AF8F41|nr:hypothetical protein [Streptomyces flavofungini]WJV47652.1 hypothetical protein QUY26_20260 [Streptomyces flavofungini]
MVTEQEIAEQVAAVEAAEVLLDQAEDFHQRAASERSVQELAVAKAEAHAVRDKLRSMRARFARERASERARAQAEAAFPPKRRQALTQQLGDSRDEAAHAITSLERAAAEALRLVAEYAAAVREVSAELVGVGLRAGDGGEDGGSAAGAVRLGGETWRAADAGAMVAAVMQAAVAAHDRQHVFAQLRWAQLGGVAEAQARAELLARAVER